MSKLQSLSEIKEGNSGIVNIFTDENIACKLISMGILPGANCKLVRKAPFGGGYYLRISDSVNIAIRQEEAKNIMLEIED